MTADNLGCRLPTTDADDVLDELSRGLNALFERVARAIEAQRQFAADASHELRTPLAIVIGELEVARRRPRTSEAWQDAADRALDELRTMASMIDTLLQTARTGTFDGEVVTADLVAVVANAITRASPAAARRGVSLVLEGTGQAIDAVIDINAIGIVLANLLSNATAHSPPGETVHITVRSEPEHHAIIIDDEGDGVRDNDRE